MQVENDKLWQQKKEVEEQVQLLEAKNNQLKQIHPLSLADKEKHDLETTIALLQEKNQQLQYFKNYQDKLVSAKRFVHLNPLAKKNVYVSNSNMKENLEFVLNVAKVVIQNLSVDLLHN